MMDRELAQKLEDAVWIGRSLFERGKTSGSSANMSFFHNGTMYISQSGSCFGTLKADEFRRTISWNREDDRVIRYLKGETISLAPEEGPVKDWCLVCVDGSPLGFAKGTGMALKNKYYPGWRWM